MTDRIKAAQALIAYLGEMQVTAVICGGYARDTYCDKPIRDVDVYVAEDDFWSVANALFGDTDKRSISSVTVDEDSFEYLHQNITRQFEDILSVDLDFGLPTRRINLIGVNSACAVTVEAITERYNLGICKAGIDQNGLYTSNSFLRDREDQQITLFRDSWGYEATMKQFIKLQAKYPWPLRVPEKQEGLF